MSSIKLQEKHANAQIYTTKRIMCSMEDEEVGLPGHGLVQAFGQRNGLEEGLQHSKLPCLVFTCDTEQRVNKASLKSRPHIIWFRFSPELQVNVAWIRWGSR